MAVNAPRSQADETTIIWMIDMREIQVRTESNNAYPQSSRDLVSMFSAAAASYGRAARPPQRVGGMPATRRGLAELRRRRRPASVVVRA